MSDSEENPLDDTEVGAKKYVVKTESLIRYGWGDMSLRPYQLVGVNWMIDRYYRGHGCILGDEMGLGKTCQTIAVIAYINGKTKAKHPHLVVCPRSVLENWQVEVKRFTPGLRSQVYLGEKQSRHDLANSIKRDYRQGKLKFDVLISTYEICIKDASFLQSLEWNLLVVDEAHRLKNLDSLLYKTLSQWDFHTSLLLTGTPIQNNLRELYALLSFVSPKKFPTDHHAIFVNKYSNVTEKADDMHHLLRPYLLLRRKNEVLKDLPHKSEIVLTHGISNLQAKLYKGILMKDTELFESNRTGQQPTRLMNILMQLRKCVNHPYLFDGVEPEPFALGEHLVTASSKLVVIDKLLAYLKETGHKVLMFSQMTHMLDILQDYLGYRGYSYERLDGSVRGEERFLAVQSFNKNDDTFIFLLSTRAGGVGINLTSADTVIFVDSDFNPQNDLQAAARAHRIGQTRPVKIIRLTGRHTVEEIILKRAEEKLKLSTAVIKEGEFSLGADKTALFTDDKVKLLDILKYGVDELFGDGDEDRDGGDGADSELDFRKILGPTADGEWQLEEEETGASGDGEGDEEDEGILEDAPQSMYMFEGTDYSKEPTAADKAAFDKMLEAEKAAIEAKVLEDRPSRAKKQSSVFMAGLPDVLRKPRKKLSPEELEQRKKQRMEAAERRAKETEEQEMRRAQALRKKKEEMWKKNKYESCNIELDYDEDGDSDDEVAAADDDDDDDGDVSSRDIKYVSGDVTKPRQTDRIHNIIVHCADDSGNWGKGGLFSAIAARSSLPEQQYTLAGKMQDLALGDCHLVPVDDETGRKDGHDWLGLIIAQHRDRKNNLSGIKLSALRYGLEKVYKKAKELTASVHLPRIGHDTPGFNWYGTEKLIKKHLATKGVPTYIYYFPRQHQKRKGSLSNDAPKVKASRSDADVGPSTSGVGKKAPQGLLDIFSGTAIYLHRPQMPEVQYKNYKRYILAYNGDVDTSVSSSTSHIVIAQDCDVKAIGEVSGENLDIPVVTTEWLDDCLQKRKLIKTDDYAID
ncbi:chromodomain-helicase-DNA-binding protein 1-like [Mya arenaria]|uniref:chromodomain-helicase-DNA-binding protein 1-like n=1 Tax=Mya arenaria TaxID=6604 RepID=UPI0022E0241C|nr:chromodomain-helicase-DNA-binding protein 1-like [Mya arenaria]